MAGAGAASLLYRPTSFHPPKICDPDVRVDELWFLGVEVRLDSLTHIGKQLFFGVALGKDVGFTATGIVTALLGTCDYEGEFFHGLRYRITDNRYGNPLGCRPRGR
jgi:hypothetical protein